jgi:hypothetical protein
LQTCVHLYNKTAKQLRGAKKKKNMEKSIASRVANARSGMIVLDNKPTEREAQLYAQGLDLTPEVYAVENAPNSASFHKRLFTPKIKIEAYDGGYSIYVHDNGVRV